MHCWTATEAKLQEALKKTKWDMFKTCADDVVDVADLVMCYIGKLIDNIVPKVTVKMNSNQKPYVDRSVHTAL